MGYCYFKLNRFEAAVKEFNAVLFYLKAQPDQSNFDIKMGSTLRNLGTLYLLHMRQYHKAWRAFDKALEYTPSDEKIRLGIIFSACKLNDEEMAMEHLMAFDNKSKVKQSISDWSTSNEVVKGIVIDLYKERSAMREFIPIEKII